MIGEIVEGAAVLAIAGALVPAVRYGALAWVRTRTAEQFSRLAREDVAMAQTVDRLPEQMRRAEELAALQHRESVAKQAARTILAEANVELVKQRAAKAIEDHVDGMLALPADDDRGAAYRAQQNAQNAAPMQTLQSLTNTRTRRAPWEQGDSPYREPGLLEMMERARMTGMNPYRDPFGIGDQQ